MSDFINRQQSDDLIKSVRLDVIDDLVKEFASNGGNSYFVIDGQKYPTDTGYAMDGIELFVEKLKERASKEIEQKGGKYAPTIESSAHPEPSIPLSWIEEHIEWLKSLDNELANLATIYISAMMEKWRGEQDDWSSKPAPKACENCPNHPNNGGSGVCNCTLGMGSFY